MHFVALTLMTLWMSFWLLSALPLGSFAGFAAVYGLWGKDAPETHLARVVCSLVDLIVTLIVVFISWVPMVLLYFWDKALFTWYCTNWENIQIATGSLVAGGMIIGTVLFIREYRRRKAARLSQV